MIQSSWSEDRGVLLRVLRLVFAWALALALVPGLVACRETAKEHLRQAQVAVQQKDADRAEQLLKNALKKDAKLIEARRELVRVHMLRKRFDRAEEDLLTMWTELGYDRPDARETVDRKLVQQLFIELYKSWARSLDIKDNPEKYREILNKALARDPRNADLHKMLVSFYQRRALEHIERKDHRAAAEAYEAILALRPFPKTRREAEVRAKELRVQLFEEDALRRFDQKLKPAMVQAGRFDEVRKVLTLELDARVDRGLRSGKPEDEAKAKRAVDELLAKRLTDLVRTLGAFSEDAQLGDTMQALKEDLRREEVSIRRGHAQTKVLVPLGVLVDRARALKRERGELFTGVLARAVASEDAAAGKPPRARNSAQGVPRNQ